MRRFSACHECGGVLWPIGAGWLECNRIWCDVLVRETS